ncbi:MAG: DUF2277 domain-containing protein [Candidatus Hodarchaeales archaeon]|jgi:hypothetical protein
MCRNIRPLFNFEPPATEEEILKASEQFVRKISGFNKPSKVNEGVFNLAISEISKMVHNLLNELVTNTAPKNRDIEAEKSRKRFEKNRNMN